MNAVALAPSASSRKELQVLGWSKTLAFTGLVIVMATITGWAFGAFV